MNSRCSLSFSQGTSRLFGCLISFNFILIHPTNSKVIAGNREAQWDYIRDWAKNHRRPFLLASPHARMQREKKMCKNTLKYLRREMNLDRAGSPPSVVSPQNCSDFCWKCSCPAESGWWEWLLLLPPTQCLSPRVLAKHLYCRHPLLEQPQLLPAALSPQGQTYKAEGSHCQWTCQQKIYCDLGKK